MIVVITVAFEGESGADRHGTALREWGSIRIEEDVGLTVDFVLFGYVDTTCTDACKQGAVIQLGSEIRNKKKKGCFRTLLHNPMISQPRAYRLR